MNIEQHLRRIGSRMAASVLRAIVSAASAGGGFPKLSIVTIGARTIPDVEYLQPQGVYFLPPSDAEGVALAPSGQTSAALVVCASSRSGSPSESLQAGEGGLHLLGTYKVFLAADGKLSLGAKEPDDFAALASKVDAAIGALQAAYDSHTHTTACTAGGAAVPPTTMLAGPQPPVGSTSVKVQS